MTSLDRRAFYATKLENLQKQCEGIKLNVLSLPDTLGYLQKVDKYYSAFVENHHKIVAATANEEMQNDEGLIGVEIGIVYRDVQSRLNKHISELSPSAVEEVVDLPSQVQAYVIEFLLSLPKLQQPTSAANIRKLNDEIDNILMQLRVMNVPIQQWNDDFIFAITQCMDASTYQAWESHHDHKMPTLQVICDFLVDRAQNMDGTKMKRSKTVRGDIVRFPCLECQQIHPLHGEDRGWNDTASEVSRSTYVSSKQEVFRGPVTGRVFPPFARSSPMEISRRDPSIIGLSEIFIHPPQSAQVCPVCKGNHKMYRCTTMLREGLQDRWFRALRAGVCLNCMIRGHSSFTCKNVGACSKCGVRHNSILCPQNPNNQ